MAACGGSSNSSKTDVKEEIKKEAKIENTSLGTINYSEFKIGNRDKAYFKMVDGGSTEIKLGDCDYLNITAEFEIVKTFTKKLGQYSTEQAFVELLALDEDGNSIKLISTSKGAMRPEGDSDGSRFADFLRGEPGSTAKFTFTGSVSEEGSFEVDKEKTIEAAKKIAGFQVLTEGLNY